jgi:hypothetical protein
MKLMPLNDGTNVLMDLNSALIFEGIPIRDLSELREARLELEAETQNYLKAKGWEFTPIFPSSFWLWQKTFNDGRIILVNYEMAIIIEEKLK